MDTYNIRRETATEQHDVENLIRDSFWNIYRPGCTEHFLMHCLRNDKALFSELNLVMTIPTTTSTERMIGQILCMNAILKTCSGLQLPIMTFGPVCIHPDFQHQGYGKALVDYTMKLATQKGYGAICIEGNPDFYGKCGFKPASSFGLRYHGIPTGEDTPFFLCKELKKGFLQGIRGEYAPPQGYFIDETECEAFDLAFPHKEKLRLPGQLF